MSNIRYYSKSRRMNDVISTKLYDIYTTIKEKYEQLQNEEFESLEVARNCIM